RRISACLYRKGLHFPFFLSINTSLLLMIDRTAAIGRLQSFANQGRLCSDILALEFFRSASFLVAHQNSSRLVPVGQHPALADPAVDPVLVPGGAVGVAVDEARVAVRAQQGLDRAGVDVHDLGRLALLLDLAPRAQRRDAPLALGERLREEVPLPG